MTVSPTGSNAFFPGNGVATTFTFGFAMPGGQTAAQSFSELVVTYFDPSGVAHIVPPGISGYTLFLNAPVPPNPTSVGGQIVYSLSGTPIASGASLNVQRILPPVQGTSLVNQGTLWQTAIEQALDYLTMVTQQLPVGARAIVGPPTDPSQINYVLPPVASRASLWLGFDGSGNVIVGNPPVPPGPQTISALWTFNGGIAVTNESVSGTWTLTSAGTATFNGPATFNQSVTFAGTSPISFSQNVTFNGPIDTFNGQVQFNSTTQYTAGATFSGGITISSTANISGTTNFTNTSVVTFANGFTTSALTNTTFNGNATFNGNTTLGGALSFTGSITFTNTAIFQAAVTFSSATIPVQFNDGFSITAGTAAMLAATFGGAATFNNSLTVASGQTATFNGAFIASASGSAALSGITTFGSGGSVTFNGPVTWAAAASWTVNSSSMTFANAPTFSTGANMAGNLNCSAGFAIQTSGGVAIGGSSNPGVGALSVQNGVALLTSVASNASGGLVANGVKFSSATNLGLYFGTGAPTFSAAQGSLYMNVGGSSTSTRLYVATNATGTWTNFVSAV